MSFSVREGVRIPPSLRNVFKEIAADVGAGMPTTGELTPWAEQGVLLLNSIMTVREARPARTPRRAGRSSPTRPSAP